MNGKLFVVSAPAGAGKTTLVQMITSEIPQVCKSVSHTTRAPRDFERPGYDYHFISPEQFQAKINDGEFLEFVNIHDHFYGTSRKLLQKQLDEGKSVILVIDTEGAFKIKKLFPATLIFIIPPSMEVLKERLLKRGSESIDKLEKRLEVAKIELTLADKFDYQIINEDLNTAFNDLKKIISDHK